MPSWFVSPDLNSLAKIPTLPQKKNTAVPNKDDKNCAVCMHFQVGEDTLQYAALVDMTVQLVPFFRPRPLPAPALFVDCSASVLTDPSPPFS